jgi:diacylglycerol kinase (ATP)
VPEIAVILNPRARSERASGLVEKIREMTPNARVLLTRSSGDARRLAAECAADGFGIVVAGGGDGTVNEVANGLAGTGATLGVLPLGTMNVFAREHGIPTRLEDAWALIGQGHIREIDLASANGAHFIQLAGIGLDAQVVKETTWESKKAYGPLSYLMSAAQVAARTPPHLLVEANGESFEGSFVLVGNGRYYGAKIAVFPDAKPDDGLLDVLIFKHLSYMDIGRYLSAVLIGQHTAMEDVEYFQTAEARVSSDEEVPVEVDGELSGSLPVTLRVAGRLRVCVP